MEDLASRAGAHLVRRRSGAAFSMGAMRAGARTRQLGVAMAAQKRCGIYLACTSALAQKLYSPPMLGNKAKTKQNYGFPQTIIVWFSKLRLWQPHPFIYVLWLFVPNTKILPIKTHP